jgi:SAM-dependent methyltransferase
MKTPVSEIWNDVSKAVTMEELTFLKKCFRAYSSKGHIRNVMHDLEVLRSLSSPPQRILDFGCGIGLQSYLLAKMGYQVIGLETVEDKSLDGFLKGKAESHIKSREESMENVWRVINKKTRIDFRFYDGKKVPFDNGAFDIVFAYAVLEHIPPVEVSDIITEINRILKEDGLFYIFQLPQRTSYTEFIARKLGMESHEFLWDLKTVNSRLKEKGFTTVYSEKVDMLINHPYRIVNPLARIIDPLNRLLCHTPLSYFAHHLTIISKKNGLAVG